MRIVVNENEILKNSVYQHKRQIEKLEEKETQSTKNIYEEIKKKNVYYKKINDLSEINEELLREINLNKMTKNMRELNGLKSRS